MSCHQRTADDVSVHDQIIWNLHVNGIDELLLFLGSNPDEVRGRGRARERERERVYLLHTPWIILQSQWCMHVLEITFLMLKEQVCVCVQGSFEC